MNIKIGSSWIFNTDNGEASKVIRDDTGRVIRFDSVFTLIKKDEDSYKINTDSGEGIPLGVIRKGIEMLHLEDSGKLAGYSKKN